MGAARSQPRPRAHSQSAFRTALGVRREGALRWTRPVYPARWYMPGHVRWLPAVALGAGRLQRRSHACGAKAPREASRARSRLPGTSATRQRGAPRSPPARAARNARGGANCGALWAQASTTRRPTPRATWRRTVGGGCRVLRRRRIRASGSLFSRFKRRFSKDADVFACDQCTVENEKIIMKILSITQALLGGVAGAAPPAGCPQSAPRATAPTQSRSASPS